MSEKLTEIRHSELTTILENLGVFGVTANGLRRLHKLSWALSIQLAHMIENGVPEDYTLPPGLPTFELTIDSRNLDLISKKLAKANIFESIFVGRDLLEKYSKFPSESIRFIAINPRDFDVMEGMKSIEHFSSDRWLAKWSKKNLFGGYRLSVCRRKDAAVHIALAIGELRDCHNGVVLITGKNRGDWITIENRGDLVGSKIGFLHPKVDFSYNRPALFELVKHS